MHCSFSKEMCVGILSPQLAGLIVFRNPSSGFQLRYLSCSFSLPAESSRVFAMLNRPSTSHTFCTSRDWRYEKSPKRLMFRGKNHSHLWVHTTHTMGVWTLSFCVSNAFIPEPYNRSNSSECIVRLFWARLNSDTIACTRLRWVWCIAAAQKSMLSQRWINFHTKFSSTWLADLSIISSCVYFLWSFREYKIKFHTKGFGRTSTKFFAYENFFFYSIQNSVVTSSKV